MTQDQVHRRMVGGIFISLRLPLKKRVLNLGKSKAFMEINSKAFMNAMIIQLHYFKCFINRYYITLFQLIKSKKIEFYIIICKNKIRKSIIVITYF